MGQVTSSTPDQVGRDREWVSALADGRPVGRCGCGFLIVAATSEEVTTGMGVHHCPARYQPGINWHGIVALLTAGLAVAAVALAAALVTALVGG